MAKITEEYVEAEKFGGLAGGPDGNFNVFSKKLVLPASCYDLYLKSGRSEIVYIIAGESDLNEIAEDFLREHRKNLEGNC